MKSNQQSQIAVGILSLLLFFSACRNERNEPNIEPIAQEIGLTVAGKAQGEVQTIGASGKSFFIKVNSPEPWRLSITPEEAKSWITIKGASEGFSANQLGIELQITANQGKERQATLTLYVLGKERAKVGIIQQANEAPQVPNPPTNGGGDTPLPPNNGGEDKPLIPAGEHIHGTTTLIEVPRLMGGNNMYFVTFRTADNKPNYSVEYDVNKRHARWVAFSWDKESAKDVTNRSDAWAWDPIIPSKYSTESMFSGSGFSRGHLVASNDRQHSLEANKQTFYYCNMSPQRQSHNGGVWLQLEELLQSWARAGHLDYDTLYVAKGGTIADDQIEAQRVRNIIVVPKYYWMAVLLKKGNTYHSIGFWTEHQRPNRVSNLRELTRTIDEIEALTGIDLFHNIEDSIEQVVEAEMLGTFKWPRL